MNRERVPDHVGANFFFNATPGTYTLTVNTVDLSITVNPVGANCDLDQLWLVGAGVVDAGWSWDTPVAMPCSGDGVYSVDVNTFYSSCMVSKCDCF